RVRPLGVGGGQEQHRHVLEPFRLPEPGTRRGPGRFDIHQDHVRGPGFVEVRDRRSGSLSRFVIDDPAYLGVVDRLIDGADVADLPADVLAVFVEEGLAGLAGESAWWLPYRVRRWPWPSMIV
ncbi:MAG: DUF5825 family protein, partial [Catenulispora sp.]